jgi:hypothetical protein
MGQRVHDNTLSMAKALYADKTNWIKEICNTLLKQIVLTDIKQTG